GSSQFGYLGEWDAYRGATLDVAGLLTRIGIGKGEEDRIASGKRFSTRHRQDCVADSTSLNLGYPLFARGVTVHLSLRTMNGGEIDFSRRIGSLNESCLRAGGGITKDSLRLVCAGVGDSFHFAWFTW